MRMFPVRLEHKVVIVVAALAGVGCTDGQTPVAKTASPTSVPTGACDPTKVQPFAGAPGALIGGNLAYLGTAQWRLNRDEKAAWLWRTTDHTVRLKLSAERTDARIAPVVFDLGPRQPSPDGTKFAPEWGGDLIYGGYVGLGGPKLPEVGCWRLSTVGGALEDATTIRVVLKQ
jgi:hypothetical protein